jgi:hypothetical protein
VTVKVSMIVTEGLSGVPEALHICSTSDISVVMNVLLKIIPYIYNFTVYVYGSSNWFKKIQKQDLAVAKARVIVLLQILCNYSSL